jgi:hypothetical protein
MPCIDRIALHFHALTVAHSFIVCVVMRGLCNSYSCAFRALSPSMRLTTAGKKFGTGADGQSGVVSRNRRKFRDFLMAYAQQRNRLVKASGIKHARRNFLASGERPFNPSDCRCNGQQSLFPRSKTISFALVQSEEIDTRNVIVNFVQISAMRVLTASVTPCCVECVWWAIFQLKILRWRRRQIHLPL